jgi:Methylase involved in ubiquinone/menaquinone biosynthesis
MNDTISPEMESLKSKLKTTWEAGDFTEVAKHIETVAQQFVERLNIQPGMKVLDVACGSGNLAIIAAQKGAKVTGIDIADNLIDSARTRADAAGLNIKFEVGDAEAMPYEDNSFDLVMTMFGAMFAPRPEVAASELVRVCRPDGTIAMANWTPNGHTGQMFKLSSKYLPPPPMPPPIQWGIPEMVTERFGDSVKDLKMTTQIAEFIFDYGPAEVVKHFKQYFGPTVIAYKLIAPEHHEAFRADTEALWTLNNTATDGTTLVKSEYLEVIATKK